MRWAKYVHWHNCSIGAIDTSNCFLVNFKANHTGVNPYLIQWVRKVAWKDICSRGQATYVILSNWFVWHGHHIIFQTFYMPMHCSVVSLGQSSKYTSFFNGQYSTEIHKIVKLLITSDCCGSIVAQCFDNQPKMEENNQTSAPSPLRLQEMFKRLEEYKSRRKIECCAAIPSKLKHFFLEGDS